MRRESCKYLVKFYTSYVGFVNYIFFLLMVRSPLKSTLNINKRQVSNSYLNFLLHIVFLNLTAILDKKYSLYL